MYFNLVLLACFLACLQPTTSYSVTLPKKCHSSDSKCIKSSAQDFIPYFAAGIPELGIEKMDPLFMKYIDGSTSALKLSINDITITGLSECRAKQFQLSDRNSINIVSYQTKLKVKILCNLDGNGQYEMKGQISVLPIEGKGKIHAVIKKIQITVEADLKEVQGTDGLTHWAVGPWKHSYVLKDKASLEFENLFNGNELLARAAKELISSSPNEVVNEIAPPVVTAIGTKIIENVKKMFEKIPLADLIE